jgi:hypothetical protein
MLEELNGRWTDGRLDSELINAVSSDRFETGKGVLDRHETTKETAKERTIINIFEIKR